MSVGEAGVVDSGETGGLRSAIVWKLKAVMRGLRIACIGPRECSCCYGVSASGDPRRKLLDSLLSSRSGRKAHPCSKGVFMYERHRPEHASSTCLPLGIPPCSARSGHVDVGVMLHCDIDMDVHSKRSSIVLVTNTPPPRR